jgi:hypothetical protein
MPFLGLGLHTQVAIFSPICRPESGLQRGARDAVAAAARSLDSTLELREARAAFEYTRIEPTRPGSPGGSQGPCPRSAVT